MLSLDHDLALVVGVVAAEVIDKCGGFALKFGVKGLDDIQAAPVGLAGYNPIYVGIVVHADADGRVWVQVLVSPAVQLGIAEVIAETVELLEVAGVIFVSLAH